MAAGKCTRHNRKLPCPLCEKSLTSGFCNKHGEARPCLLCLSQSTGTGCITPHVKEQVPEGEDAVLEYRAEIALGEGGFTISFLVTRNQWKTSEPYLPEGMPEAIALIQEALNQRRLPWQLLLD